MSSVRVGRTTLRSSATTWRKNSAIRPRRPRRSRDGVPRLRPTSPVLVWLTGSLPDLAGRHPQGASGAPGPGPSLPGRAPPPSGGSVFLAHPVRGAAQGRRDLNPQPPVLETGALPIELLPYGDPRLHAALPAAVRGQGTAWRPSTTAEKCTRPAGQGRTGSTPTPRTVRGWSGERA